MTKVSEYDRKSFANRGRRIGSRFMAARVPRNAWSFAELYGRSTRWAVVFRSRQASERTEAVLSRLRNELLDCISLSTTPLMDALRK